MPLSKKDKRRFFYGNLMVAVFFGMDGLTYGVFMTAGIFFNYILAEYGWLRASMSGAYTVAYVLMGSAASVHERLPWIAPLAAWLRPLLAGEIRSPLLGICFGHQLIAHVAGGTVAYLAPDRTKRLGVESSRLEGGRLLPGRHTLRVVVSHREEVSGLPDGFLRVARRPGVAVDGMEHAEFPVYSFQFHPEAGAEFAGHVGLDPVEIDERVRADSRKLLGAFRDRVLAGCRAGQGRPDKN